jgi:ribosomal protein S18 acetylase RimI-like enzyme
MNIEKVDPVQSAPQIYEIVKKAFNRPYDKCPTNVQEVIDYIRDSEVYILRNNAVLVGYFVLKKESENTMELKSIAVSEEHQGKGYGLILMNKVLELTKGNRVHFVTHPKNTSGLFLYLKNGFEITGWIDDYLGDGEPRLRLEKEV